MIFGIPQERVLLGVIVLAAFGMFYDTYIVDWLETHDPLLPAQTALEVVFGTMVVLSVYLLAVRDIYISGIDSFALLVTFFIPAGFFMTSGSHQRTVRMVNAKGCRKL